MSIKHKAIRKIEKWKLGKQLLREQKYRILFATTFSFILNLLYAFYHGVLGFVNQSSWFLTLCAYYAILSTLRFSAVLYGHSSPPAYAADTERFVARFSGALLTVLCLVLTGVIYISLSQNIAAKYGEIVMITIATYTFGKIIAAIVKAVKQHKNPALLLAVVRNIGYAEVAASLLTLQRSMLVSFGTMDKGTIQLMNSLTGAAVCLFILILGIVMIGRGQPIPDGKSVEEAKQRLKKEANIP